MAKKKKLTKAERKEARLRKGKQWLLTYTGSPKKMNKHYRERFHVDAVTAAKDLQELGSIIHRSSSGNNCADGICTICNKKEEPVKAPRRYVISKSCFYVPVRADYIQVWPGVLPSAQPD